ncbi:MAG: hypothetical protein JNM30_01520 [Rhodospirillales bacterium]|nr:hypothetical protein [Rhodospirillales bacterium]
MGDRFRARRHPLAYRYDDTPTLPSFLFDPKTGRFIGFGHNNPPPEFTTWSKVCWTKAHQKAWKNPPIEVIRLRVARARELGMTYKEYTAVILDRGVYL